MVIVLRVVVVGNVWGAVLVQSLCLAGQQTRCTTDSAAATMLATAARVEKRPLLLLLLAMKICFVEQTANLVICSPTNGGRSSFCSDVLFLIFSDRLLKEKSCCRCCCFASDWPLMSALLCCVEVMITNSHYWLANWRTTAAKSAHKTVHYHHRRHQRPLVVATLALHFHCQRAFYICLYLMSTACSKRTTTATLK